MVRARLLVCVSLGACSAPADAGTETREPSMMSFEATVRIDAAPGAKRFQGVWLDRADHAPLLVDYRAQSCWQPFAGKRVTVTGRDWSLDPRAQQIRADHFRVHTLRLVAPTPEDPLVAVGPEQELTGTVETLAGEPGSKMEGSTWTAFVSTDGRTWQLYDSPADLRLDVQVVITAREVERSPFAARMGGPVLWIGRARTVAR